VDKLLLEYKLQELATRIVSFSRILACLKNLLLALKYLKSIAKPTA
jgi:hypothetical protein